MLLAVATRFCSVPSAPVAVQLHTNHIQLCTQMSSWAVLTIGQGPWWVVFGSFSFYRAKYNLACFLSLCFAAPLVRNNPFELKTEETGASC